MGTFSELHHKTSMEDTDFYLSSFDLEAYTQNCAEDTISVSNVPPTYSELDCMQHFGECLSPSSQDCAEDTISVSNVPPTYSELDCMQHFGECLSPSSQDCAEDTISVSNVPPTYSELDCMQHFGECLSPSSQDCAEDTISVSNVPPTYSELDCMQHFGECLSPSSQDCAEDTISVSNVPPTYSELYCMQHFGECLSPSSQELHHKTSMEDTDFYLSSFDFEAFTQNCAEDTISVSNVPPTYSELDCMQHFGECLSPSSQGSYQMSEPRQTMGEIKGSFEDVAHYHRLEISQPGFLEHAHTEFYPGYHQPVPKNMCTRGQFMPPEAHTQDVYFDQQAFQECPWSQQDYGGNPQQDWQQPTDLRNLLLPPYPTTFTQLHSPNDMSGQGSDRKWSFPAEALGYSGSGPIQLWQFLLKLLSDNRYQHSICWTENRWEFKLSDPNEVARLWGIQKNKSRMTYEKLSRGLRYYYSKNLIQKTAGKRYVYRFVCDLQSLLGYAPDEHFDACLSSEATER